MKGRNCAMQIISLFALLIPVKKNAGHDEGSAWALMLPIDDDLFRDKV
jgi:hypothetical protein